MAAPEWRRSAHDLNGRPQWIPHRHYDRNDAFYEGSGRYGLFFTCNSWANSVLKECGLPAAMWTATANGVLRQYSEADPATTEP